MNIEIDKLCTRQCGVCYVATSRLSILNEWILEYPSCEFNIVSTVSYQDDLVYVVKVAYRG